MFYTSILYKISNLIKIYKKKYILSEISQTYGSKLKSKNITFHIK